MGLCGLFVQGKEHHLESEFWILTTMRTILGQNGPENAPPQQRRRCAEPPRNWGGSAGLFLCQFLSQADTDPDALHEARPLVVTAEGTERIQDGIHLPEGHAVHGLVEGMEVRLGLCVVHVVDLVVGFVETSQDGITVAEVWRILCDKGSQLLKVVFHISHLQSVGDSNSGRRSNQVARIAKNFLTAHSLRHQPGKYCVPVWYNRVKGLYSKRENLQR